MWKHNYYELSETHLDVALIELWKAQMQPSSSSPKLLHFALLFGLPHNNVKETQTLPKVIFPFNHSTSFRIVP